MRQRDFDFADAEFDLADRRATIRGECDLCNARDIERWLSSFGDAPIDVDLSGVTFFGASALRALIAVASYNSHLRIVDASPVVRRVIDLTESRNYFATDDAAR